MVNIAELTAEIEGLRALRKEGNYWDFKREWHDNQGKLLHDIICLANNLERDTSYLIIGIDEDQGFVCVDVNSDPHRQDTNNLTTLLSHKRWYGGIWPNTHVETITIDGAEIDVIVIESIRQHLPYTLEKPFGGMIAYAVYLRRNDSNTPINEVAKPLEVEAIWRRHFELDLEPIARMQRLLLCRENWAKRPDSDINTEEWYCVSDPRFSIKQYLADDSTGYEFYLFNQPDVTPHWGTIELLYENGVIGKFQTAGLDGLRYITPVPSRAYLNWDETPRRNRDLAYRYFDMTSLNWILHRYCYTDDGDDETFAHDRFMDCVLVFVDESERLTFEADLVKRKAEFIERVARLEDPYLDENAGLGETMRREYASKLKQATILGEMLGELRARL